MPPWWWSSPSSESNAPVVHADPLFGARGSRCPGKRLRRWGSPNGARERQDIHPRRAGTTQHCGCGARRRAGRIDVVDEQHAPRNRSPRAKHVAHVASASGEREPRLTLRDARPFEKRLTRKAPASSQLVRERFRRMTCAFELTHSVGRDIGDDVCGRPLEVGEHELGCQGREPAEPALLPGMDEGNGGARVGVGGRGGGERETPAGALQAASNRPGRGRAAACAARQPDRSKSVVAGRAEARTRPATGDTARRQQEIDEPRRSTYGRSRHVSVTASQQKRDYSGEYVSRSGSPASPRIRLSASSSCSSFPMSYQVESKTQPYTGSSRCSHATKRPG